MSVLYLSVETIGTRNMERAEKRMGMKSTGEGEIVQVQGGHIVRSTGRKDRHSKVYTSKGPRDRRVRLSAHTAIQFYDVQDRLGYDRPSKAVDWLIKKAKSAIDKLAELPPWNPGDEDVVAVDVNQDLAADIEIGEQFQLHRQLSDNPDDDSGFLSQSIDHDVIPDTMKSFFPTSSVSSSLNFQSYHHPDLTSNHTEDLGLSLQSFQNQGLIHRQSQASTSNHQAAGSSDNHDTLFPGSAPDEFDAASFHRMVAWSNDTGTESRAAGGGGVGDGFGFNQRQFAHQQTPLGHSSGFSQGGPLQSSFYQSIHTWNELSMASADHNRSQEIHQALVFGRSDQGLPGFSIPGRVHGKEERSVMSDRPSSSSPNSRH